MAMLGGDDAAADARAQYSRDHAADLKHFKSQGGITTVDATGAEQPTYDPSGGLAYKPTTISPVTQLDDGRFYRVDRDATGNQKYFDLLNEGSDGVDYHTANTGSQFVQVPAGNGQSRRVVIGQDNHVATSYALGQQIQGSQNDAEQASLTASQAQEGVAGAGGFGALPLSNLRQQHTAALGGLTGAQQTISQGNAFLAQGGTFTPSMLSQYRTALDTQDQIAPPVQALQTEIDSRESTVTQAQQQHTAAMGAVRDLAYVRSQIAAARTDDDAPFNRNLAAVDAGQPIDPTQAKRYTAAGLLAPTPQADGSTSLALTDTARALLPKPDASASTGAGFDPAASLTMPAAQLPALQAKAAWQAQKQAVLAEFPQVAQTGSVANQTFIRAYQRAGSDPRKAVQVARAVFGTAATTSR